MHINAQMHPLGLTMEHPDDIPQMEVTLKRLGVPVSRLCENAGINQSTWGRWKRGVVQPNFTSWNSVVAAYQAILSQKDLEGAAP